MKTLIFIILFFASINLQAQYENWAAVKYSENGTVTGIGKIYVGADLVWPETSADTCQYWQLSNYDDYILYVTSIDFTTCTDMSLTDSTSIYDATDLIESGCVINSVEIDTGWYFPNTHTNITYMLANSNTAPVCEFLYSSDCVRMSVAVVDGFYFCYYAELTAGFFGRGTLFYVADYKFWE